MSVSEIWEVGGYKQFVPPALVNGLFYNKVTLMVMLLEATASECSNSQSFSGSLFSTSDCVRLMWHV